MSVAKFNDYPFDQSMPSIVGLKPAVLERLLASFANTSFDEIPAHSLEAAALVLEQAVDGRQNKHQEDINRVLSQRRISSFLRELSADPDAIEHQPNLEPRSVASGHYVPVNPTELRDPRMVIFSDLLASELGWSEETCRSQVFLKFFSGLTLTQNKTLERPNIFASHFLNSQGTPAWSREQRPGHLHTQSRSTALQDCSNPTGATALLLNQPPASIWWTELLPLNPRPLIPDP